MRDEKTATKLPPTPFITGENTATPGFEANAISRINPPPEEITIAAITGSVILKNELTS